MDTKEVAQAVAAMCKEGKHEEAGKQFWADNVVSFEAMEGPMARVEGREGVEAKSAWWYANHEVHSATTEGPYVHGDQFALQFAMDVTMKENGKRMQMTEIGLYTVKDGKIVEERFFY
ncbi:nuclear transport factor 2 family protein [Plastoroseomonas arctica]|uniref:Nuclear transport factor 2 family protein n=1 Tax=Plastoroseomonas arctica TaxID=1509237 RepID=A0AAF1K7Q6_9PROT|nr:nuclear transport factor 2 family protein [Plastoroseomonas arctica]MBR0657186.1 nuclear transport factor 2 family protein [Plastoroseomonas arctica]